MTPAEQLAAQKRPSGKPKPLGNRPTLFSCKIRQLRNDLRLSGDEVAKAVGTNGFVQNYVERGGDTNLYLAFKYAKFFGKTIEELWEPLPVPEENGEIPVAKEGEVG